MSAPAVVEVRHIGKTFPGVIALDDVSVAFGEGSCHALVGENGAGKSTLGKIICGLCQPDKGEILLSGVPTKFSGPQHALRVGISIVHQELIFCENLSVAENLCLDDLPHLGPFLDKRAMLRRAEQWLEAIKVDVDPKQQVGALPISKQQLVQIAGAVGKGARILIFDEPTSSLSLRESAILFDQIRMLCASGVSCIYVSHRLEEIFELCNKVTVLRDGRIVATNDIGDLNKDSLVRLLIGRELETSTVESPHSAPGNEVLTTRSLSSPGKFDSINLTVRRGEIVGVAGLVGSGRTEMAEAIFGLDPEVTGEILVDGSRYFPNGASSAMKAGIGLVPEDRKRQGLVLSMNAKENISLPILKELARLGFIEKTKERRLAEGFFQRLSIKAPSINASTLGLSGGNQQKLVIAKWLAAHCTLLILDEPTRGVDVGAKAEIHSLIREFAQEGKGVLVITSELPELMLLATRIVVMRSGKIVGELDAAGITELQVMQLMTGVAQEGNTGEDQEVHDHE